MAMSFILHHFQAMTMNGDMDGSKTFQNFSENKTKGTNLYHISFLHFKVWPTFVSELGLDFIAFDLFKYRFLLLASI
jgi:hypothetical protein